MKGIVLKKPANSYRILLGKAVIGILLLLPDRQVLGANNLPVAVAQSGSRKYEHELTCMNESSIGANSLVII